MNAALARFLRNDLGQAAVEFALVFPIFLAMCFGIVEAGRALWIRATLQEVASDAARCYSVNATTCPDATAVKTYAISRATGMVLQSSQITPSTASCGRRVVIAVPFDSLVSDLVPWDFTLTADSCFPVGS